MPKAGKVLCACFECREEYPFGPKQVSRATLWRHRNKENERLERERGQMERIQVQSIMPTHDDATNLDDIDSPHARYTNGALGAPQNAPEMQNSIQQNHGSIPSRHHSPPSSSSPRRTTPDSITQISNTEASQIPLQTPKDRAEHSASDTGQRSLETSAAKATPEDLIPSGQRDPGIQNVSDDMTGDIGMKGVEDRGEQGNAGAGNLNDEHTVAGVSNEDEDMHPTSGHGTLGGEQEESSHNVDGNFDEDGMNGGIRDGSNGEFRTDENAGKDCEEEGNEKEDENMDNNTGAQEDTYAGVGHNTANNDAPTDNNARAPEDTYTGVGHNAANNAAPPNSEDSNLAGTSQEDLTASSILQGIFSIEEMLSQTQTGDLRRSMQFIHSLRAADLDNSGLDQEVVERLRNPIQEPIGVLEPDLRLSIDLYLALENASEDSYCSVVAAIKLRFPDSHPLSYEQVRKKVAELSGVQPTATDMCVNSCQAFTGPLAEEVTCSHCSEPRYDQDILQRSHGRRLVARRKFHTIPLGPQLQAAWRDPEGAKNMRYRARRTDELRRRGGSQGVYKDYTDGSDYLDAVRNGRIEDDDIALMFSIDGAQLYQSKMSDCWIYIWVVLNYSPELRYKKKYILPGAFIPGPRKPKNLESYLFVGLSHLAGLQKEGLKIWDSQRSEIITSYPFLFLVTADGPAMASIAGLVGHHGRVGCRLYCGTIGRHKDGGSHYYPALSRPHNYTMDGCDHDAVDVTKIPQASEPRFLENLKYLMESNSPLQYRQRRLETGIAKPSIFLGLVDQRCLGILKQNPLDLMHLISLNFSDLFLGLLRADIDVDYRDDVSQWDWAVFRKGRAPTERVWKEHGRMVAATRPYLPTSFDRPPRNPQEKINSGYKAWEFLNYVFGVGPGVFLFFLPRTYYEHYCKIVSAIRVIQQCRITGHQILEAHTALLASVRDFELLYYRQEESRLHFCRQSIHLLLHLGPETLRLGPLGICTQWPMERTIGNLGQEIRQHSTPYANLSERGVRRCRVNALKVMIPDLESVKKTLPHGADDLGDGFALLRARDSSQYPLSEAEGFTLQSYLTALGLPQHHLRNLTGFKITRWARLQLPNGQIARSAWKEKTNDSTRRSRNVKIQENLSSDQFVIGEVQFYFKLKYADQEMALAMVSRYSPPSTPLLKLSSGALYSCRYVGNEDLLVTKVKSVRAVVGMVKHEIGEMNSPLSGDYAALGLAVELGDNSFYLVEKIGLDVLQMTGFAEDGDE